MIFIVRLPCQGLLQRLEEVPVRPRCSDAVHARDEPQTGSICVIDTHDLTSTLR